MKGLHKLFRILFGLTFILSGFTKLIDPVGTSLIVKEYFSFMHLLFLSPLATVFAVAMSALEMLTGICVLTGIRPRIFSFIGMAMMIAFTLVTIYLVAYNPISDCGCFGEAIHLTNWQSLAKNLVLLPMSMFLFLWSTRQPDKAPAALDWIAAAIFALFATGIAIDALRDIPRMDFTAYRTGTDMSGIGDIALWDKEGNYRNDIFTTEGPMAAAIVTDNASMNDARWAAIAHFRNALAMRGIPFHLFADDDTVPAEYADDLLVADRKSLITLIRSNGGAVYLYDGIITHKWSARQLAKGVGDILGEDADVTLVRSDLKGKEFAVTAAIVLALFIAIFLIVRKAVCHSEYNNKTLESENE